MKSLLTVVFALILLLVSFQPAAAVPMGVIVPTFSIDQVVPDESVTIRTANFPAGQTFTVRMGPIGTRGINGTVVTTTSSGAGGSFVATYSIPAGLRGSAMIAIRLQSPEGYYAYNWFYNTSGGAVSTPVPGPAPAPGYSGIPTFSIESVVTDTSVSIRTANFPANQNFTVRMGAMGTRGVNGTVVTTTSSGAGGAFSATYNIPAGLRGASQIAIRLESPQGYYAYNWFYNSSSGTTPSTPVAPAPGYSGIPTVAIQSVAGGTSVTLRGSNFPPNQTFTVRMGAVGTQGVNGTAAGTYNSGTGGAFTATFNIPAALANAYQIAIRLESSQGYYAYNWFYNTTYP